MCACVLQSWQDPKNYVHFAIFCRESCSSTSSVNIEIDPAYSRAFRFQSRNDPAMSSSEFRATLVRFLVVLFANATVWAAAAIVLQVSLSLQKCKKICGLGCVNLTHAFSCISVNNGKPSK